MSLIVLCSVRTSSDVEVPRGLVPWVCNVDRAEKDSSRVVVRRCLVVLEQQRLSLRCANRVACNLHTHRYHHCIAQARINGLEQ